jgi:NDP-sugar pyrophosphorylase family protein
MIESGTFIDSGGIIGDRALIYSNVSISYSIIGDDVVILAGARTRLIRVCTGLQYKFRNFCKYIDFTLTSIFMNYVIINNIKFVCSKPF